MWEPLARFLPFKDKFYRLAHAALAGQKSRSDIDLELRAIANTIVGPRHRANSRFLPVDFAGFFRRGGRFSEKIVPFMKPGDRCLEFGGGIGRLSAHLTGFCRELVSVDIRPLMKVYGPIFAPSVRFLDCADLAPDPAFDFCFSVAVFFHLSPAQQQEAIQYIHGRMKPGGRVLIDLVLGEADIPAQETRRGRWGNRMRGLFISDRARFMDLCGSYFNDVQAIDLFNTGVMMRKAETRSLG